MRFRNVLLLICLAGCVSKSVTHSPTDEVDVDDIPANSTTKYFHPGPSPTTLQAIAASEPKSVEQFIALVPEEIRRSYALVPVSGDIQESSLANPRVLMFTATADLVVAFSGSPAQANGNTVEAIEYDNVLKRYDFHQFIFADGRMTHVVNPRQCQTCHSENNLPLWAGYATWPGTYGSVNNDFHTVTFDGMEWKQGKPEEGLFERDGRPELNEFKEFSKRQASHPRYSLLLRPTQEPYWPFDPLIPDVKREAYDYNPNRRLTIGLSFHAAQAAAQRLIQTELFKNYPASITYGLWNCPTENADYRIFARRLSEAFYSIEPFKNRRIGMFDDFKLLTLLTVSGILPEGWNLDPRSRMLSPVDIVYFQTGFYEMEHLSYIAASALYAKIGKDVDPEGPTARMATRMGAPVELLRQLNELAPLYAHRQMKSEVCPSLVTQMHKEVSAAHLITVELGFSQLAELQDEAKGKPGVLRRCIGCHTGDAYPGAPEIPFDRPGELDWALKATAKSSPRRLIDEIKIRIQVVEPEDKRMPKGPFALFKEQRDQLMRYLEQEQR